MESSDSLLNSLEFEALEASSGEGVLETNLIGEEKDELDLSDIGEEFLDTAGEGVLDTNLVDEEDDELRLDRSDNGEGLLGSITGEVDAFEDSVSDPVEVDGDDSDESSDSSELEDLRAAALRLPAEETVENGLVFNG